jgi:hypothetical protein
MPQAVLRILQVPFSRIGMVTDLTFLVALYRVQFYSGTEFSFRQLMIEQ